MVSLVRVFMTEEERVEEPTELEHVGSNTYLFFFLLFCNDENFGILSCVAFFVILMA